MRQKNEVELNLGTGAKGEACMPPPKNPKRARRPPTSNARRAAGPSMEAVIERENPCRGFAKSATTVTGDDRNRGMSSELGSGGCGLTVRQRRNDPRLSRLQIMLRIGDCAARPNHQCQ